MTLNKTRFTLRLDDSILNKIKIISEKNRRSINAQIEHLLEQCVSDYEKLNGKIEIDKEI